MAGFAAKAASYEGNCFPPDRSACMGSGPSMGVRGKLLYAELAEDMLPAEDCSFFREGGRDSLPLRLGVFAGLAV